MKKSHTYSMHINDGISISSHFAIPTAWLHGWLPSSDAAGIMLCKPFPAGSSHFAIPTAWLHGWLPTSDAAGIMLHTWQLYRCRRHQMLVASYADAPLGAAKWLVEDVRPPHRLPLGRRLVNRHKSFHHIFWIVIEASLLENICHFVLERHMPMMFSLIINISLNRRHERLAVRKGTIATLPTKGSMEVLRVNPFGRLYLQRLHKVSDRLAWVHTDENVNMVGSSVDSMNKMFPILACTNKVAVEFALPAVLNKSFTLAYGKNDVHINLCVGIGHCFLFALSHTYGMLVICGVHHFPAISKPLTGHLHGWLPLSDAYGIFLLQK